MRVSSRPSERRGIGERVGGRQRSIEEDAAVVEPAEVDADRARDRCRSTRGMLAIMTSNRTSSATASRATSAIVSASSTRSLRSNSRAMHALWIFIFRLPTPSAPNTVTPSRSTPLSVDLDAFDAERRHGVDVGGGAQPGAARPRVARHQADAGGAGVEQQLRAFEHARPPASRRPS